MSPKIKSLLILLVYLSAATYYEQSQKKTDDKNDMAFKIERPVKKELQIEKTIKTYPKRYSMKLTRY